MPTARSRAARPRPLPFLRVRHPVRAFLARLGLLRGRVAGVSPQRS